MQMSFKWLHSEKKVMGNYFESLYTTQGIQDIIDQLGRIQYGYIISVDFHILNMQMIFPSGARLKGGRWNRIVCDVLHK